ncbi:alanine racemase C-terminal domain-containing protein [Microbacterium sp. X-17]|uniref:alanine racemase C-terminal domain-containing protein n=1 Tax=Microbacterium sp. X-17 TaxID=3144404 RepID=UPI0031F4A459
MVGSIPGPVAQISHTALRANAAPWSGGDAAADLRADAWGHGAVEVAATLLETGIARVVVEPAQRDDLAERFGSDRVLEHLPGGRCVDLVTLFGLSGDGGHAVMRLSGSVLSVKELRAGEGVSYGYTHRAAGDTRIALVTGGYAQGIVRALGNRVTVTAAGERHPIIGRVAMDVCVIEIGAADLARGDDVVFFGEPDAGEPPVRDWSEATGLHAAEIITVVGLRAGREHLR